MDDRIINPSEIPEDFDNDNPLRPQNLNEYIGQEKVKENLKIFIEAAKIRKEPLDHVLLYGPPGLGKTTLSMIIAKEMGVNIRITSGPAIEKPGDLAALLTNLSPGDVLFIDEIHRLSRSVEEILYPAMEDFAIDIVTGKGQMATSYHLPLSKFTLIGATTRAGQLTAPLRDRFGVVLRLEMYTPEELSKIIKGLKRVRDFAQVLNSGEITYKIAKDALDRLGVDELGLDTNDRRIIDTIISYYGGGPVGLETLASAIGEEAITIEDVYEPFLMQIGFISRTPRGRCVTAAAYSHMGYKNPHEHDFENEQCKF